MIVCDKTNHKSIKKAGFKNRLRRATKYTQNVGTYLMSTLSAAPQNALLSTIS